MNRVITVKGMAKRFGANEVLRSVDLDLEEGTILGLVGRNGAGKTTFIKCLLGLLHADAGEVSLFGESCRKLSAKVKHRIGYVPQVFTGLAWMRVSDLLDYTKCFYDRWNDGKVDSLLGEWDLDPYAKVKSLSEGEKQKLAIIQSMGHEPELFIFDEPVASLDPLARRDFIRQLIELNSSDNRTMLFSTHITSDLERVAADIAFLKAGEIQFCGALATLKEQVVRLHIQSPAPIPESFEMANAVSRRVNGRQAVVTVNGYDPRQVASLEASLEAEVRVEHLNLEDIFLELNR